MFLIAGLFLIQVYAADDSSLKIKEIKELHEREIAADGRMRFSGHLPNKLFLACSPRESRPYQESWDADLLEKVFDAQATKDLMNCGAKSCAFNFLPEELSILSDLKGKEERFAAYQKFYSNRAHLKTRIDDKRSPYFIRSQDEAFDFCQSQAMDDLLDHRPLKQIPFRLSHVHYNPRSRQTTRLVQGLSYPLKAKKDGVCYAEALIFSDHYDLERVEVWKMERIREDQKDYTEVQLQIRHRIDLLSTWFRRLNKGALRDELKNLVRSQLQEVANCVSGRPLP